MPMPTFTPEQYQQILQLINKPVPSHEAVANMASIFNYSNVSLFGGTESIPWVVDTWATNHMISSLNMLLNPELITPNASKVHLSNGHVTSITHDLYTGKVKGISKEKDGLYLLQPTKKLSPVKAFVSNTSVSLWLLNIVSLLPNLINFQCGTRDLLMRMKSDVIVLLRNIFTLIKTQFFASIKTIRSDNGLEFFNSQYTALFTSFGVVHQSSCVHTPQQNGVDERKHKHLLEMARALMFQAYAPLKFWGEFLSGKSPYEAFHGTPPSVQHLKVFGCLCYATKSNFTDKFSSKVIPDVFMGYSDTQKGYKLYNIVIGSFFISRDVSFRESVFPLDFPVPQPPEESITDFLPSLDSPVLHSPISQPASPDLSSTSSSHSSPLLSIVGHSTGWMSTMPSFRETCLRKFTCPCHMHLVAMGRIRFAGSSNHYGLKQASRHWNLKLTTALINSSFTQSKVDYSLFTKRQDTHIVIILVYVDDLLITGSDIKLIQEAKHILNNNFKVKDLDELKYFLGIEFFTSSKGIHMN
ncbi:uncharacterized protein LOC142180886 [Nicotiana tabacum]|uniref:Uncharacterized protein LOC142180886 n=1 Tax=Nicotiana tabacum TaxID=4097 RepID=A0AC58UHX3_TOBAC